MKNLTHKLEIPKEEYLSFLERSIIPKLRELDISTSQIGVHIARKENHKTVSAYYIINSRTKNPIAYLSTDGKLEFYLPKKYNKFLQDIDFLKAEREN